MTKVNLRNVSVLLLDGRVALEFKQLAELFSVLNEYDNDKAEQCKFLERISYELTDCIYNEIGEPLPEIVNFDLLFTITRRGSRIEVDMKPLMHKQVTAELKINK